MSIVTWIIVIVAVLAIIGMGLGTFLSGVWSGAQKVGSNSFVQNVTQEAKDLAKGTAMNATGSITG